MNEEDAEKKRAHRRAHIAAEDKRLQSLWDDLRPRLENLIAGADARQAAHHDDTLAEAYANGRQCAFREVIELVHRSIDGESCGGVHRSIDGESCGGV